MFAANYLTNSQSVLGVPPHDCQTRLSAHALDHVCFLL